MDADAAPHSLLSQVNRSKKSWRLKVKILRVFSYFITCIGHYWSFVIADENGTKMEMCIVPTLAHIFKGLENEEGNWIEIDTVEVTMRVSGFKPSPSKFMIDVIQDTRIRKIDPINNNHFMEFVNFAYIRDRSTDRDVAIDTMGVIYRTSPIAVNGQDPSSSSKVFYIREVRGKIMRCVAYGTIAHDFDRGFADCMGEQVIVVLKFWRIMRYGSEEDDCWVESAEGISDVLFNPAIGEVEDLREEIEPDDEFVAKHRPIR